MDVREGIRTQPMKGLQIQAMIICLILTMMDGFEILVMAFVAPHLGKAWGLSPVEIGYLLSAGIFGMAIGSALISPLADRIGRRKHAMLCLVFIIIGMALSATAGSVTQMVIYRAFAGIFIGGLVATLNVTVSEYSSDKRRGSVMGIYGIGFPLGAAIGGFISAMLIGKYGWPAPFIFGAALSATMLLIVAVALPESVEYLVARRPAGALEQYNRIATRLGYDQVSELPEAKETGGAKSVAASIFGGIMGKRTLFLWAGYALLTACFYFANTWTAKLLSDVTGDPQTGVKAGILVPLGGVIGALFFAALSLKLRPRLATATIMALGTVAFLLYSNSFSNLTLALSLALLVGTFANGGVAAFYAISSSVYPASARASGVGWMMAAARVVSILTPIVTGYLLAAGWTPRGTYVLFAGFMALAGVAVLMLDATYRGEEAAKA